MSHMREEDTDPSAPRQVLVNVPLVCPKCKQETVIHVKESGEQSSKSRTHKTQSQ